MYSIIINNVNKSYQNVIALTDINISINKGEIFGLIGPDGAGKTSLIRILATLILPDSGDVSYGNLDVIKDFKKLRKMIGYMPGKFSLYPDLSIEENINLYASVFGTSLKENYHLIKEIYSQIEPFKKRPAGKLSGGMKQKLALSCALIHKPEYLLLDEPTTGVDPVSRKEFWDMLKRLNELGITIFVSTPYMDEASLCDRVGLIQNGKILDIDTPENIVGKSSLEIFKIKSRDNYHTLKQLRNYSFIRNVYPSGEVLHYIDNRNISDINILKNDLNKLNIKYESIIKTKPDIEDCFINLADQNGI